MENAAEFQLAGGNMMLMEAAEAGEGRSLCMRQVSDFLR
jgi:hypothetical protein